MRETHTRSPVVTPTLVILEYFGWRPCVIAVGLSRGATGILRGTRVQVRACVLCVPRKYNGSARKFKPSARICTQIRCV